MTKVLLHFNYVSRSFKNGLLFALLMLLLVSTKVNSQTTISQGLLAYYPFNGNDNDASGNNNNPTFNSAQLVPDRFGNPNSAYSFNGSSFIEIPDAPTLTPSSAKITISLWVRPDDFYADNCKVSEIMQKGDPFTAPAAYGMIFSSQGYSNGYQCSLPLDTLHQTFLGPTGLGNTYGNYQPYVKRNNWYNLVYTYDGFYTKLYVNNVLKFTTQENFTTWKNNQSLFLGKSQNLTYPFWFTGAMDDVRIYDRAITQTEVTTIFLGSPLPLTFKSFNANLQPEYKTSILFTTTNEINTANINIERSYNSESFSTIGTQIAKGGQGLNEYNFTDAFATNVSKVYYRLKSIDKDGNFQYSKVISVSPNKIDKQLIAEIYPNPISNGKSINLNIQSQTKQILTLSLYDATGKIILNQKNQVEKGATKINLQQLQNLKLGIYQLVICSDNEVQTKKIVKAN